MIAEHASVVIEDINQELTILCFDESLFQIYTNAFQNECIHIKCMFTS